MNNDKIGVGTDVIFVEGKNNKHVAYDCFGKVILCKHNIPLGFAKIKTVEEKDNYYLVTAEHIVKDLYPGINYNEFLKVLPLHGYKIGFDRIFKHQVIGKDEYIDEHQIFAYNLKNKVVIVANTFRADKNDKRNIFNNIDIYLPGVNCFNYMRNRMFSCGNYNMTVLNPLAMHNYKDNLLVEINDIMEKSGGDWPAKEYPNLWTYEKSDNVYRDESGDFILGEWSLQRLKLADPECLQIFEGCDWIKNLNESNDKEEM